MRDLTVPSGSSSVVAISPCDLPWKKASVTTASCSGGRMASAAAHAVVLLHRVDRLVRRGRRRRQEERVVGIKHAPAVAAQRVDAQISGDREDPRADRRFGRVVGRGFAPYDEHRVLRQLLGELVTGATILHIGLHPRCEIIEQGDEGAGIAALGDGHEMTPVDLAGIEREGRDRALLLSHAGAQLRRWRKSGDRGSHFLFPCRY